MAPTGGATSASGCVSDDEFTSAGIKTFFGDAHRQSWIWIAPDATAVRATGWSVLGPSVLIPTDGPFATPTP